MGLAWAFSRLHEGNSRILFPLLLKPCAFFGKKRRGEILFWFYFCPQFLHALRPAEKPRFKNCRKGNLLKKKNNNNNVRPHGWSAFVNVLRLRRRWSCWISYEASKMISLEPPERSFPCHMPREREFCNWERKKNNSCNLHHKITNEQIVMHSLYYKITILFK